MKCPLVIRLLLKWHARYFVRVMYHALLERDSDEQGLASHSARLGRNGDLIEVARDIARSEEAWITNVFGRPAPIVSAAFRGLLGRDPEPEAMENYSDSLRNHRNLPALLDDIGHSEEHWQRLVAANASEVVRSMFLALLKREPDPEALAVYTQQLRQTADWPALLSAIATSAEHRKLLLPQRQSSANSLQTDDLPMLLGEVVKSPKVWSELAALRFPQPALAYEASEQDAWVFIHVQKTGGTSLQQMLVNTFGNRHVYREHADTLYRRSPAELAQYTVFAGHFDFTSVTFIPRRNRRLFTFLREPRQRLLSHYRFLRAHEPGFPVYKREMKIANRLEPVDFFRSVVAQTESALWNHLTWCVMGQHKWNAYRQMLSGLDQPAAAPLLSEIRGEIQSRLHEFAFIGLQEDFQHSCQRLFELMGAAMPYVRHDHSVELLSANLQYFKYVARRPLTPELEAALSPLVQLDEIVYQEAADLYAHRYGRTADAGGYRAL